MKPQIQRIGRVSILIVCLSAGLATAQNPPMTGDPYAPRGNPKSQDGKYEWIVQTTKPIRYELISVAEGKELATVNTYYPEANGRNIRYAKAYGIFWNKGGNLVALDELNRRRAGHLYFFVFAGGKIREVRSENILPIPSYADEGRIVVDPGWISATKIRVRQALKTKTGEFASKYFTIDFADPDNLKIEPSQ